MKIVSDLLQSINGIEKWFIISLLIFFPMFIIFLVRTLKRPRKEMEEIKNSILDDNEIKGNITKKQNDDIKK